MTGRNCLSGVKEMDAILYKYRADEDNYLVYDVKRNAMDLDGRTVRTYCAQNFGLGAKGILAGPVMRNDHMEMTLYTPEGTTQEICGGSRDIARRYLRDAGYEKDLEVCPDVSFVGKGFCFA